MAIQQGNLKVVTNNLQLYYNREFLKSFRGEATTNLLTYTSTFASDWAGYCGSATNITYNTTDVLDPFGGYNALKVIRNGDNSCYGAGAVAMGLLWAGTVFLVSGQTYTASFYARGLKGGELLRYGLNDTHAAGYVTLTTSWVRYSTTFTSITNTERGFQFINDQPNYDTYYLFGPQVENKSYRTPYIASTGTKGTRSANTIAGGGGLVDLSGNGYQVNLNSSAVAFDSGGFYFNANAQGVLTTPVANSVLDNLSNNSHTYECWFKLLGTPPGLYSGYFFGRQGYHSGLSHRVANPNIIDTTTWYNDVTATGMSVTLSLNTWYHGVFVNDVENSVARLYINGSLSTSQSLTKQLRQYASTTPYYIGAASTDYASNSIVSIAKAYNRALTAAEILQNFNATRKTYNI